MLRSLAVFIVTSLISIFAHSGEGYEYGGSILHGPFPATIIDSSSIFFAASNDENYPVYFLLKKDRAKSVEILDKYSVSGSVPAIETVLFYPIKKERNIIVLVSWEINSRGVGTYGKLYQVYAYKSKGGVIVRNDKTLKDNNMFGIDGYQDGRKVSFSLKTAASIRRYIKMSDDFK